MAKVGVIIAAAGSGTRMKHEKNKVLLPLLGIPILIRSIQQFNRQPWVNEIIVVIRSEDEEEINALLKQWNLDHVKLSIGGLRRQDSIQAGLNELSSDIEWVFIHDGARPLIANKTLNTAYDQVQTSLAVGVGVPVKDTIKVINADNIIETTPDRSKLWAIQTPQVFSYDLIIEAYREANRLDWEGTDDCSFVERLGHPIKMISGTYDNLKITTPEDLELATILLQSETKEVKRMRVGIGYDVHQLATGYDLILGGVLIDYQYGLQGHSDADVVTHALMDSLLGAAGLGDIGQHFPDTDLAYLGISSIELLKKVMDKLETKNYKVNNVDITIAAEKPKLAPFLEQMRVNLAAVLKIEVEAINLKATTSEKLGFVGRGEGIATYAVATIY